MSKTPLIKFRLLSNDAKIPSYAHKDDAGFDIYSIEARSLKSGERYAFKTGLASEIPKMWYVQFQGKSGLAANYGVTPLAGVIDAGYRGEWQVVLINLGKKSVKIKKGDKIAQGILLPVKQAKIVEVKKLSETKRGKGGFGSTGRR